MSGSRITHEVLNQAPPLQPYDVFSSDRVLVEAVARESIPSAQSGLEEIGILAGSAEAQEWAVQANENPPRLKTHDRYGNRVDDVLYHPSYHRLMESATHFGLHGYPWACGDSTAHVTRAAKFFVWAQLEAGHGCPISMTYAAVPALRIQPGLAALWEPKLTARSYDPALRPISGKRSALCGMAMTEKQGGSDVRANRTRAVFAEHGTDGDAYRLTGHKWFCSAPMSDAFLTLAQTDSGLTCFLLPRVLPDGKRNEIEMQRLKDKLGNRSNASAEIELHDATALLVGEPGRGIQTIVEMVNYTRLDCINGAAALMRQAVAQAVHHATYRSAFGKLLIDQPLMHNVLSDLAIESEAATLLLFRVAAAVDRAAREPRELLLKRLGTAAGKYYICKRAPAVVAEALECLGGNGYVEESGMPRLYREAPLNSIWEGSGSVNALDVLRICHKQPGGVLEAFRAESEPAFSDARTQAFAQALFEKLGASTAAESEARSLVEGIMLLWQACLLLRASSPVADAFIDSRIAGRWGRTFGTLAPSRAHGAIVARAGPAVVH